MAKRKSTKKTRTKKDLEAKIAELEGKLEKLSSQLGQKPAEKAQTAPPPPKPTQTAKKPEESKPAPQTKAQPPVTRETLIEKVSPGIWHDRKTKTTGFVPENPRAWARRHATGADAPTQPWSLQKSKVPGYTAPSNKYYATRQRLAYHPPEKSFTGYGISLGHGASQAQTQAQTQTAPPPPQQQKQSLPKGTAPSGGSSSGGSSKKQSLEEYEKDYLARLDKQQKESEELQRAAAELAAKKRAQSGSQTSSAGSTRGSLPKGF